MIEGKIVAIREVVIDVEFPTNKTPKIYDALKVQKNDLTLEVEAILEEGRVRCVAMDNVFGISRGMKVVNTGGPISVPVGTNTLGRIFNVLGETVDNGPKVKSSKL